VDGDKSVSIDNLVAEAELEELENINTFGLEQ
jgi:hypothetical protein